MIPDFADENGDILLNFQASVVDIQGVRILVDPCIGSDEQCGYEALHMAIPYIGDNFCWDRERAAVTRRLLLQEVSDPQGPAADPPPGAGAEW